MSVSHYELHCDGIFSLSPEIEKRIENLGVIDWGPASFLPTDALRR